MYHRDPADGDCGATCMRCTMRFPDHWACLGRSEGGARAISGSGSRLYHVTRPHRAVVLSQKSALRLPGLLLAWVLELG